MTDLPIYLISAAAIILAGAAVLVRVRSRRRLTAATSRYARGGVFTGGPLREGEIPAILKPGATMEPPVFSDQPDDWETSL